MLLGYPFLLMANLMALAALPASQPPVHDPILHGFLWTSTLYPVAYLIALVGSIWYLRKGAAAKALYWQAGFFAYLLLVVGLLLGS